MTAGVALHCPQCSRMLESDSWHDAQSGRCRRCECEFEFRAFPALTAGRARVTAEASVVAEDSVCFFHASNRAATICEDCGRLLCPVCVIDFGGRRRCPTCVSAAKTSGAAEVVKDRVLFDSLALTIAFVPILLWPFTLVTAPIALGVVIYGWKKPNSLVRGRGRVRLGFAGVLALLQIATWVTVGVMLWLRR